MREKAMMSRHLIGMSAVALIGAGSTFAFAAPLMAVTAGQRATSHVQHVDCALGAHIGPLGGCILGTDDPPPVAPVVVAPEPDVTTQKTVTQDANGCVTKSVTQTDSAGNSATQTKSNC
jgi:hypothetical protein